jgi:hypothetical protein
VATGGHIGAEQPDGRRDFDFFNGRWAVRHRRLEERLRGCDRWEEFEGTAVVWPLWGGRANVNEIEAETPSGPLLGLTVRLYEPASRQWRLYWATAMQGIFDQPMVGTFRDGRGEFFNYELFEGQGTLVRYLWSEITPASCHWEQAFSPDGGRTWETNWVMDFIRRP